MEKEGMDLKTYRKEIEDVMIWMCDQLRERQSKLVLFESLPCVSWYFFLMLLFIYSHKYENLLLPHFDRRET